MDRFELLNPSITDNQNINPVFLKYLRAVIATKSETGRKSYFRIKTLMTHEYLSPFRNVPLIVIVDCLPQTFVTHYSKEAIKLNAVTFPIVLLKFFNRSFELNCSELKSKGIN